MYKHRNDWFCFPIHLSVVIVTIMMIVISRWQICKDIEDSSTCRPVCQSTTILTWLRVTGSIFLTQYSIELFIKSCCLRTNADGSDDINPNVLIWTLFTMPCYTLATLALQLGLMIWGLVIFKNEIIDCSGKNKETEAGSSTVYNFILTVMILGSCFVFLKLFLTIMLCTIGMIKMKTEEVEEGTRKCVELENMEAPADIGEDPPNQESMQEFFGKNYRRNISINKGQASVALASYPSNVPMPEFFSRSHSIEV